MKKLTLSIVLSFLSYSAIADKTTKGIDIINNTSEYITVTYVSGCRLEAGTTHCPSENTIELSPRDTKNSIINIDVSRDEYPYIFVQKIKSIYGEQNFLLDEDRPNVNMTSGESPNSCFGGASNSIMMHGIIFEYFGSDKIYCHPTSLAR